MNTFKKTVIAIATLATVSSMTVSAAQAGNNWWKKPLAQGIGVGVGLGIVGAIANANRPTVVVQQQPVVYAQPTYSPQNCTMASSVSIDQWGRERTEWTKTCY
jgi:hypothetical protein